MVLNFFFICPLYHLNFFFLQKHILRKAILKEQETIFTWEKVNMLDSFHAKVNLSP